jgi:hypothetical protein
VIVRACQICDLSEAEDVVDEEQHILSLLVAEVLGDGQTGQTDTGAGSRGLVHLKQWEKTKKQKTKERKEKKKEC